jgi:hypothetical protein
MRRNCAQNSRLGFIASGCDKAGVELSRTSNRGPQIFWASRINQHSLCTPKCLNSCIEFLNVLNGIGAEAFNGQLTEIWKLGSDGIDANLTDRNVGQNDWYHLGEGESHCQIGSIIQNT